jgi:hypothetical protein
VIEGLTWWPADLSAIKAEGCAIGPASGAELRGVDSVEIGAGLGSCAGRLLRGRDAAMPGKPWGAGGAGSASSSIGRQRRGRVPALRRTRMAVS